jgi:hypothetical protein
MFNIFVASRSSPMVPRTSAPFFAVLCSTPRQENSSITAPNLRVGYSVRNPKGRDHADKVLGTFTNANVKINFEGIEKYFS